MRRLYQIGLIISVAFLVLLGLYAHPWTRPTVETTLGPPLEYVFGTVYATIINSPPALFLIANPILLFIIGVIVGIFPISFPFIHRSFNWGRTHLVRSSVKESGLYPRTEAPTHTVTHLPATPTKTTVEKEPIPPAAPSVEEEVKPEAEQTG